MLRLSASWATYVAIAALVASVGVVLLVVRQQTLTAQIRRLEAEVAAGSRRERELEASVARQHQESRSREAELEMLRFQMAAVELQLDGVDDYMRCAPLGTTISNRTLVAWASLDNLTQQAGSALTIENPTGTDVFDGIIFAERVARQWMNGSSGFARSVVNNTGASETLVDPPILVYQAFDLTAHLGQLVAGENVLAIQPEQRSNPWEHADHAGPGGQQGREAWCLPFWRLS